MTSLLWLAFHYALITYFTFLWIILFSLGTCILIAIGMSLLDQIVDWMKLRAIMIRSTK